jgi:hypothetical protein
MIIAIGVLVACNTSPYLPSNQVIEVDDPLASPSPQPLPGQILHAFHIPRLTVRYTLNNVSNEVSIRAGSDSYSWRIFYDDGTSMIVEGSLDEVRHPLDFALTRPLIERDNNMITLEIIVEYPVEIIGAQRWPIAYIGQGNVFGDSYEDFDISNNVLVIPSEESGYVILILATVSFQGIVEYIFFFFLNDYDKKIFNTSLYNISTNFIKCLHRSRAARSSLPAAITWSDYTCFSYSKYVSDIHN